MTSREARKRAWLYVLPIIVLSFGVYFVKETFDGDGKNAFEEYWEDMTSSPNTTIMTIRNFSMNSRTKVDQVRSEVNDYQTVRASGEEAFFACPGFEGLSYKGKVDNSKILTFHSDIEEIEKLDREANAYVDNLVQMMKTCDELEEYIANDEWQEDDYAHGDELASEIDGYILEYDNQQEDFTRFVNDLFSKY